MDKKRTSENRGINGVWYAVGAYSLWGLLPGYWKLLDTVPALEILAHRVVWSLVFLLTIVFINRQGANLRTIVQNRRLRAYIVINALLISMNWFTYIYAVNSDHIVDSSFGYYINPLINVLIGVLFLRERLNIPTRYSLILAAGGVLVLTWNYGRIPWIAVSLALTFAFYGFVKKVAKLDSLLMLTLETAVVAPCALLYLLYQQLQGVGSFGTSQPVTVLLMLSGAVTAVPLLLFAQGANRITLTALGFTQYLSPTISLLIGVFIYSEPFTTLHAISFGLIWTGLLLYALSQMPFFTGGERNNI